MAYRIRNKSGGQLLCYAMLQVNARIERNKTRKKRVEVRHHEVLGNNERPQVNEEKKKTKHRWAKLVDLV